MPRRSPRAVVLALGLTTCAARPPTPPIVVLPAGDLEVLFEADGVDATTAAGALVILEPDYKHLRAIDLEGRTRRWRLRAQRTPNGTHSLHSRGEQVLLHAANRLILVDAAAGRLVGEAPVAFNGGEAQCRMEFARGACAYACSCRLQPIACATGSRLGEPLTGTTIQYFDEAGSICRNPPRLLGGVDDLTVVAVDAPAGTAALAIDSGGAVRWRLDGLVPPKEGSTGFVAGGMADDGSVCWLADRGRGAAFFACSNGQVLWRLELAEGDRLGDSGWLAGDGGRFWWVVTREGGGTLEVRDARSGARRSTMNFAAGERPWPLGAPVEQASTPPRGAVLFHDVGTGELAARIDVGERGRLRDDPRGGYLVVGDALVELDARAQERRRWPRRIEDLVRVTPGHLVVRDEAGMVILGRDDLAPALRIDGRIAELPTTGLPPEVFVFQVVREGRPGRIIAVGPRRLVATTGSAR